MDITKEYVAGLAFVMRLCKAGSRSYEMLATKIKGTGTSPDFVYGGAANDDTMKGVDAAVQELVKLSLPEPDGIGDLKAALEVKPVSEKEKTVKTASVEVTVGAKAETTKEAGGKSNAGTNGPQTVAKARGGDQQTGPDKMGR